MIHLHYLTKCRVLCWVRLLITMFDIHFLFLLQHLQVSLWWWQIHHALHCWRHVRRGLRTFVPTNAEGRHGEAKSREGPCVRRGEQPSAGSERPSKHDDNARSANELPTIAIYLPCTIHVPYLTTFIILTLPDFTVSYLCTVQLTPIITDCDPNVKPIRSRWNNLSEKSQMLFFQRKLSIGNPVLCWIEPGGRSGPQKEAAQQKSIKIFQEVGGLTALRW